VAEDTRAGRCGGRVATRYPPEPNGYLHIGHAKALSIDFGIAGEYGGPCHLRFDDTNPAKESVEYVESIQSDVRWLGYDWGEHLYFASDYFEQLYQYAEELIRRGRAYVDDLSADEIRALRGTLTEPGQPSPWRGRAGRGEPRPLPADAGGGVRGRGAGPPGQDRHGLPEPEPPRPGPLPDPEGRPPPDGRRLVHLPDVRLRPSAVRLDRTGDPLALLAGVRGPPTALRLAPRRPRGLPSPADRVRPPQPRLYPHEQAAAPRAGGGGSPAGPG